AGGWLVREALLGERAKQAVFGLEIVEDESLVDAGAARDGLHTGAGEAPQAELAACGLEDFLAPRAAVDPHHAASLNWNGHTGSNAELRPREIRQHDDRGARHSNGASIGRR